MRTEKRSAFLSGLCGVAVALGMMATSAGALVTTERGASILAFPKVLADGDADTIIQITNISNNMVHAHCFYVNAAPDFFGNPLWQVTDFNIWLTKQQPTHWQVSKGRFVSPVDNTACISNGQYYPSSMCDGAGIDPGAIPPTPQGFTGELKCVEVDVAGNPIGGNHLKGEATLITSDDDVSKYNAIGIQGTDLAGETGNELLLNQPNDADGGAPVGQYNACPNVLLLNHLADGVTDPILYANGFGGTCSVGQTPCYSDSDCLAGVCNNPPQVLDAQKQVDLRSATLTDLTLIPCTQDFENNVPERVTVQFAIYNEFEERFSASTSVTCWANFYLYQVDSPNDPARSVFSFATLGTVAAHTRITPVADGGAVLGVAGVTRADSSGNLARAAYNIHMEGDRFSASGGEITDVITIPAGF
ncbi:hypothetical protein KF840_15250 [bacterium]|nr:hypothetical protein [bacterium]